MCCVLDEIHIPPYKYCIMSTEPCFVYKNSAIFSCPLPYIGFHSFVIILVLSVSIFYILPLSGSLYAVLLWNLLYMYVYLKENLLLKWYLSGCGGVHMNLIGYFLLCPKFCDFFFQEYLFLCNLYHYIYTQNNVALNIHKIKRKNTYLRIKWNFHENFEKHSRTFICTSPKCGVFHRSNLKKIKIQKIELILKNKNTEKFVFEFQVNAANVYIAIHHSIESSIFLQTHIPNDNLKRRLFFSNFHSYELFFYFIFMILIYAFQFSMSITQFFFLSFIRIQLDDIRTNTPTLIYSIHTNIFHFKFNDTFERILQSYIGA